MSASGDVLGGGEPLLDRVRREAVGATRIRFALGYLFLSGINPIWDALDRSGAEISLLIGNTAAVPTEEQMLAEQEAGALASSGLDVAAGARAARERIASEMTAAIRANLARVPRTPENARLLTALAAAVVGHRVRVRVYPEGRLHAKAYLFERPSGSIALVGSSNVTLPSPGNATELNVVLRTPEKVADVCTWFDGLWEVSQDFSRDLVQELSSAWPLAGGTP